MKRFVYFLLIIFVLSMTAEATAENAAAKKAANTVSSVQTPQYFLDGPRIPGKRSNRVLATDTIAYSNSFNVWTSNENHAAHSTPICYDPISKLYAIVMTASTFVDNFLVGGDIEVFFTTDDGTSWVKDSLEEVDGIYTARASISIVNNDPAQTTYEGLPYLVSGMGYINTGDNWFARGIYTINKTDEMVGEYYEGPEDNNPGGGYVYGIMKMKSFLGDDEAFVYGMGKCFTADDNAEYGAYGFLGWDVNSAEPFAQSIPMSMQADQFKPGGLYNGQVQIDHDKMGNLYSAVNNMYNRTTPDNYDRTVGVAKSDDGGVTWSQLNKMPMSLLDNFAAEFSHNAIFPSNPYGEDAFFVSAEDDYSFIFKLTHGVEGDDASYQVHLTEARFSAGMWSLNAITELNAATPNVYDRIDSLAFTDPWLLERKDNPLGSEIQVARTADGNSIVLKYIDYRDDPVVLPEPFLIHVWDRTNEQYMSGTIDTTFCTDVFMAYRDLNEDSFNTPKNVTNDMYYQKVTRMPDVVESVNKVGMFFHKTQLGIRYNTAYTQFAHIPDAIFNQLQYMRHDIGFCMLDADHTPTGEISVETKTEYDFSINNVYPNPASGNAEFTFDLENGGNVSIDMFDAMGRKVASLHEGYIAAGHNGININTADYVTGSYIITLTVDGRKAARSLNIVK
ncbi:MAG: T9SS type A sorting domain-containing protein, partial [Chlorobi bacterium]|nr:T9SS type A sorting domain-containing protein [Chlorobiota bacterium]